MADGIGDGASEGVEIDTSETAGPYAVATFLEQRLRPPQVAVGQMLIADGDLDQPLERAPLLTAGANPVRLEQLVDLEAEASIEQHRRLLQRLGQRRLERQRTKPADRLDRALRAQAQQLCGVRRCGI